MSAYPDVKRDKTLTSEEVHAFLSNPAFVARRMQEMTDLSFVSDYLLRGTADATGTGAIVVEEDGPLFVDDAPEVIAPGAEYPLLTAGDVAAALIALRKKGFDSELTDEKIARSPRDELGRFLTRMANTMIRDFDSVSRGVIASKVTETFSGSAWTSASAIIKDVLKAAAKIEELELGYRPNTVVLKPSQYAEVSAALISGNALPRESGNPLLSGALSFDYMGFTWVKSIYSPFTDPFLADADNLGGIATEDIKSPGYSRTEGGIEVKSWRPSGRDDNDAWRVRTRRVAVPFITGPKAGLRITGHGLS